MKKIFKIIFFNILFLFFVLIFSEFLVYEYAITKDYPKSNDKRPSFGYELIPFVDRTLIKNFFIGGDNFYSGRLPDGLEYSGEPIIIFGCSYAFGFNLDKSQTLSAKLSDTLKRPVYNRAISGQGIQEMYYQSTHQDFYNDVKEADNVLYVLIDDHFRRLYSDSFYIWRKNFMLTYQLRYGKLVQKTYYNQFINLFRSLYTVKFIKQLYVKSYIENPKNIDKITDYSLLYFVKSREELEKHYGHKIKFNVLFYEDSPKCDVLKEKLKNNGFEVASTSDMTDENLLYSLKYMQDNYHPTEAAWNLLVPKIVERFFD